MNDQMPLVTLAVGNSRARVGYFQGSELVGAQSFESGDAESICDWLAALSGRSTDVAMLVATVNPAGSDRIVEACRRLPWLKPVLRIGKDVPIPIHAAVRAPDRVGQDRLLCAMAAWFSTQGPCVVIDVGTATTVDYIDADGVFQGGAIAPGLRMMLDAMHSRTAALPHLTFDAAQADSEPVGKDTEHAMLIGATESIRGLVARLVERYAEVAGSYPRVVATGGDAGILGGADTIVEHVVPDLQLIGMRLAFAALLESDEDGDAESEEL